MAFYRSPAIYARDNFLRQLRVSDYQLLPESGIAHGTGEGGLNVAGGGSLE